MSGGESRSSGESGGGGGGGGGSSGDPAGGGESEPQHRPLSEPEWRILAESTRICGAKNRKGEPCKQRPVMGLKSEGPLPRRCKYHGGATPTKEEAPEKWVNAGPPKGSTNGLKHGLHMARNGYIEKQTDDDQEWIRDMAASLEDRVRKRGRDPDLIDRELLKNLAIDMHKVAHANEYFANRGLTERTDVVIDGESVSTEQINKWATELRHHNESIYRRLDKHGLLEDGETSGPGFGPGSRIESDHVTITFADDVDVDQ